MAILLSGRDDLHDLFALSGMLNHKLPHTPFLAFVRDGRNIRVRIMDTAEAVAALPPKTPVMIQWQGNWRSDFFQMTAAHVAKALKFGKEGNFGLPQEACTDETGGPCPDGQWRRFAHEHAEDGYILSAD